MMEQHTQVKTIRGFSLIELMVAVAIVAILVSFAYPSYLDNVRRSSRGDVAAAMNTLANDLERFYSVNGTYTTDLTELSLKVYNNKSLSSGGKYLLDVVPGTTGDIATSYVIVGNPKPGTSQEGDTDCLVFIVNSVNQRLPDPNTSECW